VSVMVVLLLMIVAGAAVVHFKVMPLKVALDWFKPATLSVTSDPDGATVKLDGRELAGKTPLSVEVHRDRVEHTLELSRPGSKSVRATMRFDRTVPLSQSISLPEEPPPPPPPPVADPEPAPPQPAAAQVEAQAEEKAPEKAAKASSGDTTGKAAKTGKQSKSKSKKAKAASKAKAAKGGKKAKAAKAEGKPSAEPGGAEF
jgi:type IV secretory pathway VirB10-like protein